jgi:hypothetical protein
MKRSVIRVDRPARMPLPDFAALHPGYVFLAAMIAAKPVPPPARPGRIRGGAIVASLGRGKRAAGTREHA